MSPSTPILKAPFPYFGGKSKVADLVWQRLGDVDNYVEPFAGSAAVLLRRPQPGKIETINDRNHFIVNFWRAVRNDPATVADYADHPVTEADLHARHRWLMLGEAAAEFRESIESDPAYYDAQRAGWWAWGMCCWIGAGWCDSTHRNSDSDQRPREGRAAAGRGVTSSAGHKKAPRLDSRGEGGGVTAKRPLLNSDYDKGGTGVHAGGRPQLGDAFDIGRGVCGNGRERLCEARRVWLIDWFERLADRLRLVRVCYGHWSRICDSRTTVTRLGVTGAFLDPPYAKSLERLAAWIAHLRGEGPAPDAAGKSDNRADGLYHGDGSQDVDKLVAEVHLWCEKWAAEGVRIALCGYEGEHDRLEALGWDCVPWKAHGGYGNRNANNANKHRERIWFSPACIGAMERQGELF